MEYALEQIYGVQNKCRYSDVFMILNLNEENLEEVGFLVSRSLGWHVLPNSRKADTMSFEYLVINPENGEKH